MRIFVLGDSFADNLFKNGYEEISLHKDNTDLPHELSTIAKYLISLKNSNIDNPLWWTDWLEEWGYEVINLGVGGCSNQNIFYQFAKIDKEFKEGDRIILHWTDHCRFDCNIYPDGRNIAIHPNIDAPHFDFIDKTKKTFLNNQTISRDASFKIKEGYLHNNLIPFMNWIVEKHSEYNPIVWSVFSNTTQYLNKDRQISQKFSKSNPLLLSEGLNNKFTIMEETNGFNTDGHYGRFGNYYMAVLFDEIIKSDITMNFDDRANESHITHKVVNRIKNENLIFVNPTDWPEKLKENIKKDIKQSINFSQWITEKHKNWFSTI